VHLQAGGYDSKNLVFGGRLPGTTSTIYFRKLPELSQKQIIAFYPFPAEEVEGSQFEGSYGAVFVLNKEGRRRLKNLSLANLGKYLVININGGSVDYLKITEPVSDGLLVAWQGIAPESLALMEKKHKRLSSYPHGTEERDETRYNASAPEMVMEEESFPGTGLGGLEGLGELDKLEGGGVAR